MMTRSNSKLRLNMDLMRIPIPCWMLNSMNSSLLKRKTATLLFQLPNAQLAIPHAQCLLISTALLQSITDSQRFALPSSASLSITEILLMKTVPANLLHCSMLIERESWRSKLKRRRLLTRQEPRQTSSELRLRKQSRLLTWPELRPLQRLVRLVIRLLHWLLLPPRPLTRMSELREHQSKRCL